jgi:WD40 repeat protein
MRNGEVVAEIAQAHHGRVHVLQYDSYRNVVVSGGIDGVVKVWNATDFGLVQEFPPCFEKRTLFNHPAAGGMVETFGVTDIAVSETGYFASGSDGTIQYFKARAL